MKLTERRRENLAKVLFNLAQIIFGIVIVGKFITPEKVSLFNFISGLITFLIFALIGYIIDEGGNS